MVKELGTWWNDKNIQVVEIEGKSIALDGWNGEIFTSCFEVADDTNGNYYKVVDDYTTYNVEQIEEPVEYDEEGEPCQWEITEYKIKSVNHK